MNSFVIGTAVMNTHSLGSSSLVAHVLHLPPPHTHTNSFVMGTAVTHTHNLNNFDHAIFGLALARIAHGNAEFEPVRVGMSDWERGGGLIKHEGAVGGG
jgi:hypothetical protein